MGTLPSFLNRVVAAFVVFVWSIPATAQDWAKVDELLEMLQTEELPNWQMVEEEIWTEWSKSGSPSADFLLQRGRKALEAGDLAAAIDHLTAVLDHVPDFAEGYNLRASAYFQSGLFGPSMADIQQVLIRNPNHFGALAGLGTIMSELERNEAALRAFRMAAAIHPHDPDLKTWIERLEAKVSGTTL